jgi:hypothetical protein
MSNLPSWPGASTVYSRCSRILGLKHRAEYDSQRKKDTRKGFRYSPPGDLLAIGKAMAAGDEEVMKAFVGANLSMLTTKELEETRA